MNIKMDSVAAHLSRLVPLIHQINASRMSEQLNRLNAQVTSLSIILQPAIVLAAARPLLYQQQLVIKLTPLLNMTVMMSNVHLN